MPATFRFQVGASYTLGDDDVADAATTSQYVPLDSSSYEFYYDTDGFLRYGYGASDYLGKLTVFQGSNAVDYLDKTAGIYLNRADASGATTITGSNVGDIFIGGSAADSLSGGTGNDSLSGGAGNDSLSGGDGNDTVLGGDGADLIYGDSSSGNGVDSINGGAGNDIIIAHQPNISGLAETIDGGAGNDILRLADGGTFNLGSAVISNIETVEAYTDATTSITVNDTLTASGATTSVTANLTAISTFTFDGSAELDGKFNVVGGAGANTLTGGAGDDTLQGGGSLIGGGGNDSLVGGAGRDNTLVGGLGDDTIVGGDGNDTLYGDTSTAPYTGGGVDSISAGAGYDTIVVAASNISGFAETIDGGADSDILSLVGGGIFDLSGAAISNVENILFGSDASTSITVNDGLTASGTSTYVLGYNISTTTNTFVFDGSAELDGGFIVVGGAGANTLTGGTGNDYLYGAANADSLSGGGGDDRIYGDRGGDTLLGGAGSDTLRAGGDNDLFSGGGNDIMSGGAGNDVFMLMGIDTISSNDVITDLESGDSIIIAYADLSSLDGTAANLVMATSAMGTLTVSNAAAGDTWSAVYDGINTTLTLVPGIPSGGGSYTGGPSSTGTVTAPNGAITQTTSLDSTNSNSTVNDTLNNSGLNGQDKQAAKDALQTFLGTTGSASLTTVSFPAGSNAPTYTVSGSTDQNEVVVIDVSNLPPGTILVLDNIEFAVIVGSATLTGGAGSNYVIGDGNTQYIVLGPEDDTLMGGAGADTIGSATGRDSLMGGADNDVVFGGEDGDYLYGNSGVDAVYGNSGADLLYGGQGDDWMFGGQDNDTVCGDKDADRMFGDKGDDVLYGNAGGDIMFGNAGNDWLFGGRDGDILFGGAGNDVLSGDAGDDWLAGDTGADTLSGGDGTDRFYFADKTLGADVITDFTSGSDAIVVSSPNFGNLAAGVLDSRYFALAGQETSTTRFVFNSATGVLSYDADGSGALAGVSLATLTGGRGITAADITVLAG